MAHPRDSRFYHLSNRQQPVRPGGGGVFWRGTDGRVWVAGPNGTNPAGNWDANTANYWGSRGFRMIADPNPGSVQPATAQGQGGSLGGGYSRRVYRRGGGGGGGVYRGGGGAGGGGASEKPKLDQGQVASLRQLIGTYHELRQKAHDKAGAKRDAAINEKLQERRVEHGKYKKKLLSSEQDLGNTLNDTNINQANTLANLMSSLSTMGVGGGRALARQILTAGNQANRKANFKYAQNNQGITSAWNSYAADNDNDILKIKDQFSYDLGEANKKYYQDRQNATYKIADVYGAAGDTATRDSLMREGDALSPMISQSVFTSPEYRGVTREMSTPDLQDMAADVATYNTEIAAPAGQGVNDVAGNVAMRAVAVNDKDFGLKKKTEGDIAYGV